MVLFKNSLSLVFLALTLFLFISPGEKHFSKTTVDEFTSLLFSKKPAGFLFHQQGNYYYFKTYKMGEKYYRSYHYCTPINFSNNINLRIHNYVNLHAKKPNLETLILTDFLFKERDLKNFANWWEVQKYKRKFGWGDFIKMIRYPIFWHQAPLELVKIRKKFPSLGDDFFHLDTVFQSLNRKPDSEMKHRTLHRLRFLFELLFFTLGIMLTVNIFSLLKARFSHTQGGRLAQAILGSLSLFNLCYLPFLLGYSIYHFTNLPSLYGSLSDGILFPHILNLLLYPVKTLLTLLSSVNSSVSILLENSISSLGTTLDNLIPSFLSNLFTPPRGGIFFLEPKQFRGYYLVAGNLIYFSLGLLLGMLSGKPKKK